MQPSNASIVQEIGSQYEIARIRMVRIKMKSGLKALHITSDERMTYDALNHVMTPVVSLLSHSRHGHQPDQEHISQCKVARTKCNR